MPARRRLTADIASLTRTWYPISMHTEVRHHGSNAAKNLMQRVTRSSEFAFFGIEWKWGLNIGAIPPRDLQLFVV